MDSPFTVSISMLARLSPSDAENLARRMIVAEGASAGVRIDGVYTSGGTSAPDGGIDIEVKNAPRESDGGLIKKGHTAYQVKSGKFDTSRDIARTLFGKDGKLKDGIQSCLDGGGTFVVILTGWDGSDTGPGGMEKRFAKLLSDRYPRYGDSSIRVWNPGKISGLLERYPHLVFSLAGISTEVYTHARWSSHPDMRNDAHLGPEQHRFIDKLRDYLRSDDEPVLVQVSGAPGAGKTRMVLEATRGDEHSSKTVYTNHPNSLIRLLDHIAVGGLDFADLVVVVDDCTYTEQARIWYEVKHYKRVKMVSIMSEPGADGEETCHVPVPDLDDGQIRKIITGYTGTKKNVERWIGYCRPSPRAAHIVGAHLKKNPGDVSKLPEAVPVWERYIERRSDQGPDDVETRRAVLRWVSLFKTFRYGRPYEREVDCIATFLKEHHNISKGQFLDAVKKLRSTKVLQGESELYITPKLLHLHMWTSWWDTYTTDMAPRPDQLVTGGSRRLLQSYIDMFKYAKDSQGKSRIVKSLLAPGGFLESDGVLKSRLGVNFFLTLSEIEPQAALSCIERAAGGAEGGAGSLPDRLVPALARMLRDPGSFPGAMRLLLGIAASREGGDGPAPADAGGYPSSPALDACCAALDPAGPDRAARGVPLAARLAAIKEAMRSGHAGARLAAVRACGSVLAMRRASIAVPRHEGAGHVPDPWSPDDRSGAVAYYLGVLDALGGAALGPAGGAAAAEAARQAVEALRQAAIVPEMAGPAVGLAERLLAAGAVPDKGRLLAQAAVLLDVERDRMDAGIAARIAALRDSVEGSGFSADLRRIVGGAARLGWSEPYAEHAERVSRGLRRLAGEAVRGGLPGPDMEWLVTRPAGGSAPTYAFEFGLEVGAADRRRRMHAAAAAAMRGAAGAAAPQFLGGCLRAMRGGGGGGDSLVEGVLDAALADDSLCGHLPDLTHMAGASDRAARRLARGVSEGRIDPESLDALCSDGALAGGASDGALAELVDALLGSRRLDPAAAGAAALGLVHAYCLHGGGGEGAGGGARPVPLRPALDALLNGGLLEARGEELGGRAADWWTSLCIALARQHPGQAARLAAAAIDRLGRPRLQPRDQYGDSLLDVVAEAARLRPQETWGAVSARLAADGDRGAAGRALCEWMEKGGARLLPMADIIRWAEKEPDTRPALLSRRLPPDFAVARDFVARFGGRDDVGDDVSEALLRGECTGSILSHYADKRAQAMRLYDGEDDPGVLAWLDRHVERIDGYIAELAPEAGRLVA